MKMKFAYYTFILLWAVCLMTGCSIYKPYSRPEVQTEGLYRDLEETKDTASIATLGWRNLFSDKNLQALIDKGLERNTDLRVAHTRVKAAEAVLMNARLSYLPSVVLAPDGSISGTDIIRKSKFPQNPKRSVRFSGKRTKRSVQKRKARNTQKAETKVL